MNRIPSTLLTKVALGIGASVIAPIVYRVIKSEEPLTVRSVIKEGIKTYNQACIAVAEAKENLSDLVAEAQAEAEAASERTYEGEVVEVTDVTPEEVAEDQSNAGEKA